MLLFPAIGIGLVAWAIKATLGYRKFGSTYLQLATLPGAIGGRLAGRVETRMTKIPPDGCFVTFSSFRRVKRGKNTSEVTLWQDAFAVSRQSMGRGASGVFIPIEFRIPADCEPSTIETARSPVIWRLTAFADLPGVDFETSFEVPVFNTRDTNAGEPLPPRRSTPSSARRSPSSPPGPSEPVQPAGSSTSPPPVTFPERLASPSLP
jgi:hypothetical protein